MPWTVSIGHYLRKNTHLLYFKDWKTFLLQKTRWQKQQSQHVPFLALYVIGWITVKYRIFSQKKIFQYFPPFRNWWRCWEYSVGDIYSATFTWSGRFEENTFGRSWFHTEAYMQKTCDVAEKAILAKKKLRKKCVNRDKCKSRQKCVNRENR